MSAAPKCPIHGTPMKQWPEGYKCGSVVSEGPPKKYCNKRAPLEGAQSTDEVYTPAGQPTQTTALTTPAPPPQMPAWLAEPLREYIGNPAFDMLLPSVPVSAALGYGHRVAVSVVQISANPDDREVFKVGTRDGQPVFAYTKQALEKFAEAAGVQVKTTRVDDRRDPGYCEFQALGGMLSSSGQQIIRTATKAFRMEDVEAEALRNRMKLRNEDEATARQNVAAEMMAFRKHLAARTESGAVLRVFRSLLAIKSGLTAAQISRPKVLARVEFNPDPKGNPVVERYLLERGFNATQALFGPSAPTVGADVRDVTDESDEGFEQEPLALGNAPTEPASEAEAAALADIENAANALAWTESMVNTLIAKHGGNLAAARKEIVRYVDAAAS